MKTRLGVHRVRPKRTVEPVRHGRLARVIARLGLDGRELPFSARSRTFDGVATTGYSSPCPCP
jgi:hypothetical protein